MGARERLERQLTADTVILQESERSGPGGHHLPGVGGQEEHQGGGAGPGEVGGQRYRGFEEVDLEEGVERRRWFI